MTLTEKAGQKSRSIKEELSQLTPFSRPEFFGIVFLIFALSIGSYFLDRKLLFATCYIPVYFFVTYARSRGVRRNTTPKLFFSMVAIAVTGIAIWLSVIIAKSA